MLRSLVCILALYSLSAGADQLADFDRSIPALVQPVTDEAGFLTNPGPLNQRLQSLRQRGGPQIAIYLRKDLGGLTIEQASIVVADKWKLGDPDKDNGVLILVSKAERVMRVEVGQGLEGDIPDAYARRIIDELMVPAFQSGNFDRGLQDSIDRIIELSAPELIETERRGRPRSHTLEPYRFSWIQLLWFGALIWFMLFTSPGRFLLMALLLSGGGRRSSSGWGGGGGGGGFGGGGGGFSGGGASGRW